MKPQTSNIKELTIGLPDDFHTHLRYGGVHEGIMHAAIKHCAKCYGRAIAMPNLPDDMISTGIQAIGYEVLIKSVAGIIGQPNFQPLMTIKITPQTRCETVKNAKREANIIGVKIFPLGVTTGAAGGISDFKGLDPIFGTLQDLGLPVLFHAELPGAAILDAEYLFIPILREIIEKFPRLKVVVEHVTDRRMLHFLLNETPNHVGLTITAHHLILTKDYVLDHTGAVQNPWLYCKPVAKQVEDLEALIAAATSNNSRIWFGSDSAPHPIEAKTKPGSPAAGIWTTGIVALPLLAEIFEHRGFLDRLEAFVSRNGASFYGLPLNSGTLKLVKKPWFVEKNYDGMVPFMAGKKLAWQVVF